MSETAQSLQSPLPGGAVIWVVVACEILTFGLFFFAYAGAYGAEPELFRAAQEQLHPGSGTLNTAVLLIGSWLAARAAHAHKTGAARPWLAAAAVSGLVFTVIKLMEYGHVLELGVTLSTNIFWFSYLFLTGIHLLHVWVGIGILAWLAWAYKAPQPEEPDESIEAAAVYWHMVDLIWIVLFPALYLVQA